VTYLTPLTGEVNYSGRPEPGRDRMIDILVIQIAAGLVIVAVVAASVLIAWRRRDGRSEKI
jgi:hypothetical protein